MGMIDADKVSKGLEHCKKYGSLGGNDCNGHYEYTDNLQEIIKANNHRKDCPYGKCRTGCVVTLIGDTITLLKEQKETIRDLNNKRLNELKEEQNSLLHEMQQHAAQNAINIRKNRDVKND